MIQQDSKSSDWAVAAVIVAFFFTVIAICAIIGWVIVHP